MSELQPILVRINQASMIIGKCRRVIYQLIATDQLKAVKSGRSTLIVYESLKQYAANLPSAKFKSSATPSVTTVHIPKLRSDPILHSIPKPKKLGR